MKMNQFGTVILIGIGLAMCVSIVAAFHAPKNDIISKKRGVRNAPFSAQKWPHSVIVYEFDDAVTDNVKQTIESYMSIFTQDTDNCIQFAERTNEEDYLIITLTDDSVCVANRGMPIGPDTFLLGTDCINTRSFFHEILHTLGFAHEHSRPDRDRYVRIIDDNIESGREDEFIQFDRREVTTLGLPYDYYSIMHYHLTAFSKDQTNNQLKTIEVFDQNIYPELVGKGSFLSLLDIYKVKKLYQCSLTKTFTIRICGDDVCFSADTSSDGALKLVGINSNVFSQYFEITFNEDSTVCFKSVFYGYVNVNNDGFLAANADNCDNNSARFYLIRIERNVYVIRSRENLRFIRSNRNFEIVADAVHPFGFDILRQTQQ